MRRLAIVALSALMCVNAFALFSETEPNDTRATADMVLSSNVAPWSDVGVLSLTANDSDFFKIRLNAGDYLTAITFPIQSNYFVPDTVMALFDASGNTAIVWNDDAGDGFGSAIRWQADRTGDYFIAITGYHGTTGRNLLSYYEGASHNEVGAYILTVSVVPVPSLRACWRLASGWRVWSGCAAATASKILFWNALHFRPPIVGGRFCFRQPLRSVRPSESATAPPLWSLCHRAPSGGHPAGW